MGLISIGLLIWFADLERVIESVAIIHLPSIIGVCLLQMVTIFFISFQWTKISKLISKDKSDFWGLFYVNMVGTFVESITPAVKAGGELAKVALLKSKLGFTAGESVAIVGLQKAFSMIAFLLLNVVGIIWFMVTVNINGLQKQVIGVSFFVLLSIVIVLLLFLIYPHKVNIIIGKMPLKITLKQKISRSLNSIQHSLKIATRQKHTLALHLLIAMAIWLFFPLKIYLLANALQLEINFIAIAVITYLTYMVGMIPLTPGGLGAFEGSMVFFLAPLGIPVHQGMALALATRFVTFWFVFIFSAVYMGIMSITAIIKSSLMTVKA